MSIRAQGAPSTMLRMVSLSRVARGRLFDRGI